MNASRELGSALIAFAGAYECIAIVVDNKHAMPTLSRIYWLTKHRQYRGAKPVKIAVVMFATWFAFHLAEETV